MKLLKLFLLPLFFIGFLKMHAQTTIKGSFKIVNNKHPENEQFYIASIENANMEKFRLKNNEITLEFENGFECVLMSAKELFISGKNIKPDNYQQALPMTYNLPLFDITSTGFIMAKSRILTKGYEH